MSLKRVNFLLILLLTFVIGSAFYYIDSINRTYYQKESALHIKGDILELGYTVRKSIEQEGVNSSLNHLYKSLATHREYAILSIAYKDIIIISTDRKGVGKIYRKDLHLAQLSAETLYQDKTLFHEFSFIDKEEKKSINLIIKLDRQYLLENEKKIERNVDMFFVIIIIIMLLFAFVLYFANIRPVTRLYHKIKEEDFSESGFIIKEYNTLYNAFKDKYNRLKTLTDDLEAMVATRTASLIKTNALFDESQKLTHLGHWEWNLVDDTLIWSDEIYRIFGKEPQAFIPTYDAFVSSIHDEDRMLVRDAVNQTLKTGAPYSIQHRIVLSDGSVRAVVEKGKVEYDHDSKPFRMVGTVQDITDRSRREKELELQSRLLNSVSDSIFVHYLDGSFLYFNEAAYKTRGYTKDELNRMKVQDLDYHDDKLGEEVFQANLLHIQEQLQDKGKSTFEVSHRCKNGKTIPLEVTSIIMDAEPSYMISIARDITERKKLYHNLEVSEK